MSTLQGYQTPITHFYKPEDKEEEQQQAPLSVNDEVFPKDSFILPSLNKSNQTQYVEEVNNNILKTRVGQSAFMSNIIAQEQARQQAQSVDPINIAKNLVGGFLEGFTTIDLLDEPDNQYDALAFSIGHFLGFAGWVPMPGKIGRLVGQNLIKAGTKLPGVLNANIAGKAESMGMRFLRGDARLKSVPILAADWMMKGVNKYVFGDAAQSALKIFREGSKVRDIAEGALHLGFASGVSAAQPWELELKNRFEAFLGGAEAGAVFRGIGNVVGRQSGGSLFDFSKGSADKEQLGNKIARSLAASLYMGMPSTLAGDPTLFQVYNYIQGAGFGYLERSSGERHFNSILRNLYKDNKETLLMLGEDKKNDRISGYKFANKETKDMLEEFGLANLGKYTTYYVNRYKDYLKEHGIVDEEFEGLKDYLPEISSGNAIIKAAHKEVSKKFTKEEEKAVDEKTVEEDIEKEKKEDEDIMKQLGELLLTSEKTNALEMHDFMKARKVVKELDRLIKENLPDNVTMEKQGEIVFKATEKVDPAEKLNFIHNILEKSGYDILNTIGLKQFSLNEEGNDAAYSYLTMLKKYIRGIAKHTDMSGIENKNKYAIEKATEFLKPIANHIEEVVFLSFNASKNRDGSATPYERIYELEQKIGIEPDGDKKALLEKEKAGIEGDLSDDKKNIYNRIIDKSIFPTLIHKSVEKDKALKTFFDKNIKEKINASTDIGEDVKLDLVKVAMNLFNRASNKSSAIRIDAISDGEGRIKLKEYTENLGDGTKTNIASRTFNIQGVKEISHLNSKKFNKEFKPEEEIDLIESITVALKGQYGEDYEYFGGGHHKESLFFVPSKIARMEDEKKSFKFTIKGPNNNKVYDATEVFKNLIGNASHTKYVDEFAKSFNKLYPKVKIEEAKVFFNEIFTGNLSKSLGSKELEKYLSSFMNNIVYYEMTNINGESYKDILEQGGSIKNVIEWNKRNTLQMFGDVPLSYSVFSKYKDSIGVSPFLHDYDGNPISINAAIFDNLNFVDDAIRVSEKIDIDDAVLDGGVFVLPEIIKDIQDFYMLDTKSPLSFLKTTQIDLENGIVGKNGLHEAPPVLAQFMRDNGLGMLYHKKAAKAYGEIKRHKSLNYINRQYSLSGEGTGMNINIKDISLIPSSTPTSHYADNQRLSLQIISSIFGNISEIDPKIATAIIDGVFKAPLEGDIDNNRLFNEFTDSALTRNIKVEESGKLKINAIDFNKVSLSNMLSFLDNVFTSNHPTPYQFEVFNAFTKHLTKVSEIISSHARGETVTDSGEIDSENILSEDVASSVLSLAENGVTNTMGILTSLDKPLSPALLKIYPSLSNNFSKAVKRFVLNRIYNPVVENSMAATMTPTTGEHIRMMIDKGHFNGYRNGTESRFYLGQGFKDKKFKVKNEAGIVVEKTLEQLDNEKDGDKEFEKFLNEFTVIRVPADSMPGMVISKFGGFLEEKGHGILLSGRDMRMLGGADNDADKAFIFGGMPTEYKELIQKNKHQWEEQYDPATYKHKSVVPGTVLGEVFKYDGNISEEGKSKALMFDPYIRFKTAYNSFNGNDLLGFMLNMSNSALGYAHFKNLSPEKKVLLNLIKREVVNLAADANGDGFPSQEEIKKITHFILTDTQLNSELQKIIGGEGIEKIFTGNDFNLKKATYQKYVDTLAESYKDRKKYQTKEQLKEFFENEEFTSIQSLIKASKFKGGLDKLFKEVDKSYAVLEKSLKTRFPGEKIDTERVIKSFPMFHLRYLIEAAKQGSRFISIDIPGMLGSYELLGLNSIFENTQRMYENNKKFRDVFEALGFSQNLTGDFVIKEGGQWKIIKDVKTVTSFFAAVPRLIALYKSISNDILKKYPGGISDVLKEAAEEKSKKEKRKVDPYEGIDLKKPIIGEERKKLIADKEKEIAEEVPEAEERLIKEIAKEKIDEEYPLNFISRDELHTKTIKVIKEVANNTFEKIINPIKEMALWVELNKISEKDPKYKDKTTRKEQLLAYNIFLNQIGSGENIDTFFKNANTYDGIIKTITENTMRGYGIDLTKEDLMKVIELQEANKGEDLLELIKESRSDIDSHHAIKSTSIFKEGKKYFESLSPLKMEISSLLTGLSMHDPRIGAYNTVKKTIKEHIEKLKADGNKGGELFLENLLSSMDETGKFSQATKEDKSVLYEIFHNANTAVQQYTSEYIHPKYYKNHLNTANNLFHYLQAENFQSPFVNPLAEAYKNTFGLEYPAVFRDFFEVMSIPLGTEATVKGQIREKVSEFLLDHPEMMRALEMERISSEFTGKEKELFNKAKEVFTLFFERNIAEHPELTSNPDIVLKLISGTLEELGISPSRTIFDVTYNDLDMALTVALSRLGGRRDLASIQKMLYYTSPQTLAQLLGEAGDDTFTEEIGNTPLLGGVTQTGEPIVINNGKVRYWKSTFGIIHDSFKNAGDVVSRITGNLKNYINKTSLYWADQLADRESFKDKYTPYMDYISALRESGLPGELYKKNLTQARKALRKAFNAHPDADVNQILKAHEEYIFTKVVDSNGKEIKERTPVKVNLYDLAKEINNSYTQIYRYLDGVFMNSHDRDENGLSIADYKRAVSDMPIEGKELTPEEVAKVDYLKSRYKIYFKLFPFVTRIVEGNKVTFLDQEAFSRAWESELESPTIVKGGAKPILPPLALFQEADSIFFLQDSTTDDGIRIRDIQDKNKRLDETAKKIYKFNKIGRTKLSINGDFAYMETVDANHYMPHLGFNPDVSKDYWNKALKGIIKGDKPYKDVLSVLESMNDMGTAGDLLGSYKYYKRKNVSGDYEYETIGVGTSPGSAHQRNVDNPMPGYSTDHKVPYRYIENMTSGIFKKLNALIAHNRIRSFERANVFGERTSDWADFMEIYTQQALGLPAYFPKEFINNPNLKLKGHPYYWATEQHWFDKAQKEWPHIFGTEFVEGVTWKEYFDFLQERKKEVLFEYKAGAERALNQLKGEPDKEIKVKLDKGDFIIANAYATDVVNREKMSRVTNFLRSMSSMEGKWELATLLVHPTSGMANWTSSHLNTAVNTGLGSLIKSMKTSTWRKLWGEDISSAEIKERVLASGAVESFLKNEFDFSKATARDIEGIKKDMEAFFKQKAEGVKGKEVPLTISGIAKKYNVVDRAVEKLAWFMRSSEMAGRNDAWLAHYYRAYKNLQANNHTLPWDHPWLIRQANKGVRETQFLYEASSKPMFMATSLGKILTRFQTFLWNSMTWRRNVYNNAAQMGFNRNSESFARLQRLMGVDMFILALASIFPMSLFSKTVPQPWDYFVNLSDFMFGNDEEREGAFYGALPYPANILQPVMPPASRYLTNIFGTMMAGDIDKFTDYYMWSWFPGGKILKTTNSVMNSPSEVFDKVTGIPLKKIESKMKKKMEEEDKPSFRTGKKGILTRVIDSMEKAKAEEEAQLEAEQEKEGGVEGEEKKIPTIQPR